MPSLAGLKFLSKGFVQQGGLRQAAGMAARNQTVQGAALGGALGAATAGEGNRMSGFAGGAALGGASAVGGRMLHKRFGSGIKPNPLSRAGAGVRTSPKVDGAGNRRRAVRNRTEGVLDGNPSSLGRRDVAPQASATATAVPRQRSTAYNPQGPVPAGSRGARPVAAPAGAAGPTSAAARPPIRRSNARSRPVPPPAAAPAAAAPAAAAQNARVVPAGPRPPAPTRTPGGNASVRPLGPRTAPPPVAPVTPPPSVPAPAQAAVPKPVVAPPPPPAAGAAQTAIPTPAPPPVAKPQQVAIPVAPVPAVVKGLTPGVTPGLMTDAQRGTSMANLEALTAGRPRIKTASSITMLLIP